MKYFDAANADDMAALDDRRKRSIEREERKVAAGRWIIYKFYDEHGRVLFEKCRIPLGGGKKTFRYRHMAPVEPHGHAWDYHKPPEADRYLYHLRELLRAKASGADVWWTEGEKDADRLEEELEGDDCTVSHHQAAGNSTPEQAEWFRDHNGYVVLLMDMDQDNEYGANPGAFDVIRRYDQLREVGLPKERLRVAAPAVGKDVHDHLSAGLGLSDLVAVTDLRPLREKAKRGNGFSAWGYGPSDPYLDEFFASGRKWEPKVVPSWEQQ